MAYLLSSSSLLNLKWTVDCHFLDVLVTRQHSGALTTTIYHKPTHTNRYLQFTSHHPRHHKLSVARSLHSRLNTHITDLTDYCVQSSHVKQTLALNRYPRKYFCGQWKTTDRFLPTRSFESFTSIPYIQVVSDKIQRVLNEVGVKVAMKPHLKIRKLLPSLKDLLDNNEKYCLVYQVPCRDCSFVYIGQMKRDLKSRLDEHKRVIKNQRPHLSALCEHSITKDHIIFWTEAKILELETDYRKRLSLESWHINAKPHVMNRNDGSSFPAVYLDLLKL